MSKSKTELGRQLSMASMQGNLTAVKKLLAAGADMEVSIRIRGMLMSALNAAAYANHENIVQVLLKAGADPSSRQSTGHTPLHCAAFEGQTRMMRRLLDAGADPTLASVEGQTPLHTAAQNGHAPEVAMLIEAGASINAQCQRGYTPLRLGSWMGNAAVVDELIKRGADVHVKDYTGSTVIHGAVENGCPKIMRRLLKAGADPNVSSCQGCEAPLFVATTKANVKVIRLLLEAGANPNYMTASGMTAVTVATIQSDVKSLATLLDAGAVPDRQRVSPNALQTAILNSSHVCLSRLLRAGADPSMAYPKQPKKLVTMLREFWSKNAPRGSVVWQMRRIMYRAYAYTADSWRWPKHDPVVTTATSAAGGEGGEEKNEEGREQGCVGVKKRGTEEEQPSNIGKRATGVASYWRFRSRTADGNRRQVAVLNAMFRFVDKADLTHTAWADDDPQLLYAPVASV